MARALTVAAVVAAAAGVFVAAASAVAAFRTPGHAVYCGVSEGERPYALICWTPNDGFTAEMGERGTATKRYEPKNVGFHDVAGRELRFGRHWHPHALGLWCTSRSTGLTCWNRAGHGWWLGRYHGYRLF
jgi:hypothetical protein